MSRWAAWMVSIATLSCSLCGASDLWAGEVSGVRVQERDGLYRVSLELTVAAPLGSVRAILNDYEHLRRLSPAVKKSRVLAWVRDGRFRVETLTELCVLVFCKQLAQIQDMGVLPNGDLSAVIVPELGDFHHGWAHWRLLGSREETRIHFTAELRPAFWVPPVIGTWWLERMLVDEATRTVAALERLAPVAAAGA